MEPERWRRVEAAFHEALEQPLAARARFLHERFRDDAALRAEVERLLALDEPVDGTGDDPLHGFAVLPPRADKQADPLLGRAIGAYRLVSRIAAGGMGVVYRGVRADGLFEQEVAVKLVRAEAASDEARARFDLERRTLATLNHPSVARLYDGGTTEEGTPYLVMELVHGSQIDGWCDEQRLSVSERLRLFASVCRAVHFAHQHLIVHGDLKPGNVLVDASGTVKLLDFGIARLLGPGQQEEPVDATRRLARLLTPEYASPEQVRGEPLTIAADIYSLGVLLYVLVTGGKPLRSEGLSPGEWERLVAAKEPTRPSAAASAPEHAQRCRAMPARLARALRGDVDRMALMALRKEPERRYASALQLAEDIERHLQGFPVQARDPTLAYRTWTFVRRNRLAVGAALAVLSALVLGLVLALRAERRASREAEHARIEADSFREIADITRTALLPEQSPSPDAGSGGADARAPEVEALLRRAEQVRREHPAANHLRANLLDALGLLLLELGALEDAESLIREALAIREREFGPESLEVALGLRSLAAVHTRRGDPAAAAAVLERALGLHRSLRGVHTDVAMAASDLGSALAALGKLDEAERLHAEALGLHRAREGARTLVVARSLHDLALVHAARGDVEQVCEPLEEALSIREELLGADHALTAETRERLGELRAARR